MTDQPAKSGAARALGARIDAAALEQCPGGYTMTIRSRSEWWLLAKAWNEGIDSHLEALTERSKADAATGKVNVHPLEVKTLVRRLVESGDDAAEAFGRDIASTLDLEVDACSSWDEPEGES